MKTKQIHNPIIKVKYEPNKQIKNNVTIYPTQKISDAKTSNISEGSEMRSIGEAENRRHIYWYKINNNYWKKIQKIEFQNHNQTSESPPASILMLYFMFIKTISTHINSKVLTTTPTILIKEKYKAYKSMITNIFLDATTKQQIQTIFEKTQKHYFALIKFSNIIFYKRQEKKHKIKTDLALIPLIPTHKHTFILCDDPPNNQNSYLFSIPDLINIIYTAITNAPNFFEKPLQPKNPYTNVPLTTNTLQSFFYKLHSIYYPIPPILEKYYKCQFDLKWFSIQNQPEIRDISIKNFVTNSPAIVIYEEILDMISDCFYDEENDIDIEIHKDFPMNKLIEIMKPYLYLYLMSEYHINGTEKRTKSRQVFRKAKQIFIEYNPKFGQKNDTSVGMREGQIPGRIRPSAGGLIPDVTGMMSESRRPGDIPTDALTGMFKFSPNISNTKPPSYNDDHQKFSMQDIEMYLKDPSKLKQLQTIKRQKQRRGIDNRL
jgi:hypothetical protein